MDRETKRVAIYRIGHIGDMIVALPALWAVRRYYPNANITLLTKERQKGTLAQGTEVIRQGTVYDDVLAYTLGESGGSKRSVFETLLALRRKRIQTLIYMPASNRSHRQLSRDHLFFKLAGVKRVIGMESIRASNYMPAGVPLPVVRNEVNNLVEHLVEEGIKLDAEVQELFDMGFTTEEKQFGEAWCKDRNLLPSQKTGPVIGIAPCSKMLAKLWPSDRFREVVKHLSDKYGATFVFFGAPGERQLCEDVAQSASSYVNAAGELTVRESATVLGYFDMYLGNDTGTMHIAAVSGTRCVGLFSARDWAGRWYPYGADHIVIRKYVECEGCLLETCPKENLCMSLIDVAEVIEACETQLARAGFEPKS